MTAKVINTCILRYRLNIELSCGLPGKKQISVTLDRKFEDLGWDVYLPVGESFSFRELVYICEAIFGLDFIGDHSFRLEGIEGQGSVTIYSKEKIEENILAGFKAKSSKDIVMDS